MPQFWTNPPPYMVRSPSGGFYHIDAKYPFNRPASQRPKFSDWLDSYFWEKRIEADSKK